MMLRGNGSSASDYQHVATGFVSRPRANLDRTAPSVLTLTTISSFNAAFSNDWQFDGIFARVAKEQGHLALTMSLRRIGRPLFRSESFSNPWSVASTTDPAALGVTRSKGHKNHENLFAYDPSAQEIEGVASQ
jgi:hypothetical protein